MTKEQKIRRAKTVARILKREQKRRAKFAEIREEIKAAFERFYSECDELSAAKLRREKRRLSAICSKNSKRIKTVG